MTQDTLTTLRAALEALSTAQKENFRHRLEQQFNAISIRTHFYKEVPAVGTKLYTHAQPVEQPKEAHISSPLEVEQPLSDDELKHLISLVPQYYADTNPAYAFRVFRYIEQTIRG